MKEPEPLMTRKQLAAFLGVSERTTHKMGVPTLRLSYGVTRFDPDQIRTWVANRQVGIKGTAA